MTLIEFSRQMEMKLEANSHKGGWSHLDPRHLLVRLKQEAAELQRALAKVQGPGTARAVIEECADVANFAMMIADNLRDSDWAETLADAKNEKKPSRPKDRR